MCVVVDCFWLDLTETQVLYDCMHYAFHHTKLPAYLKEMKVYHMVRFHSLRV